MRRSWRQTRGPGIPKLFETKEARKLRLYKHKDAVERDTITGSLKAGCAVLTNKDGSLVAQEGAKKMSPVPLMHPRHNLNVEHLPSPPNPHDFGVRVPTLGRGQRPLDDHTNQRHEEQRT